MYAQDWKRGAEGLIMGQVSSKMRRGEGRYFHWCPGCKEMHPLPDSWSFNGNLESPTFTPSFKHEGIKLVHDESGQWVEPFWQRDAAGNTIPFICHYIITNGQVAYCGDSSHSLAGKTVPMSDLPPHFCDAALAE